MRQLFNQVPKYIEEKVRDAQWSVLKSEFHCKYSPKTRFSERGCHVPFVH